MGQKRLFGSNVTLGVTFESLWRRSGKCHFLVTFVELLSIILSGSGGSRRSPGSQP